MCDISGLELKRLVTALWTNARPSDFFESNPHIPPPMVISETEYKAAAARGYFDYLSGRGLKFRVPEDNLVNTKAYNQFEYHFTFEQVVAGLRE